MPSESDSFQPSSEEIEGVARHLWESLLSRPTRRTWATEVVDVQDIYRDHAEESIRIYRQVHDRCMRCGVTPAHGYAKIDDRRYCHGDEDESPTCYEERFSEQAIMDMQSWDAAERNP